MIPRRATILDALFPNFDRILFGGMYLPAGVVLHILWGLPNPLIYTGMAKDALLPVYHDLLMYAVPGLGVVFPLAIVVFEAVLGALILYKGSYVRTGIFLSILFQFALAPLGWWGFLNILLALAQLPLLVYDYESPVWTRPGRPVLRQIES